MYDLKLVLMILSTTGHCSVFLSVDELNPISECLCSCVGYRNLKSRVNIVESASKMCVLCEHRCAGGSDSQLRRIRGCWGNWRPVEAHARVFSAGPTRTRHPEDARHPDCSCVTATCVYATYPLFWGVNIRNAGFKLGSTGVCSLHFGK